MGWCSHPITVGGQIAMNEILTTIGAPAGIISLLLVMIKFLGDISKERIAREEKARFDEQLENFKIQVQHDSQERLKQLQCDIDLVKERQQRGFSDKLEIYRLVTNIISDALADIDLASRNPANIPPDAYDRFNRSRLKAYGYLAMLAPQPVIDGFDNLVDHIFEIIEGRCKHDWAEIRRRALVLIAAIRADIGIDISPIHYKGNR